MDRWTGKVAVITGASAGIGLATAKALVHRGLIVVGLARRVSQMSDYMKDVAGSGKFHAVQCDLSIEQQVREAFDWIKRNLGTVHILINNAALLKLGKIADMDFAVMKQMIDANLTGLLLCSKLATAMMLEGGHESHIINMNSVTGHKVSSTSGVSSNVYAATKFAVTALSQTMKIEFCRQNIRITSISPGAVETEMLNRGLLPPEVADQYEFLKAEDIAEAIIYVIGTPPRVIIDELTITPRTSAY